MLDRCRGSVKRLPIVDRLGRSQEVRVLNEPDVLRLIVGSKLPAAVEFEKWVFETVLPKLRKNGAYVVANEGDNRETLLARAVLAANDALKELEDKLAAAQPKVEALDRIATMDEPQTGTARHTWNLTKPDTDRRGQV